MYRRVVTLKQTDVSDVRTASIIRAMMEAVRTSETLVRLYFDETNGAISKKNVIFNYMSTN
jgi:hypothetical protein